MSDGVAAATDKTLNDLAFERINADRQSASEYYRAASQYLILINGVTTSAVVAYLTGNIKDIAKIGGSLFTLICLSVILFTASVMVAGIFTYFRMQAYDQWANWWEMRLKGDAAAAASAQFQNAVRKSVVSDRLFLSSIALFAFGTLFFIGSVAYQGRHGAAATAGHELVIDIKLAP